MSSGVKVEHGSVAQVLADAARTLLEHDKDLGQKVAMIAFAATHPVGYTVRVLGALDHEVFMPTMEGAAIAAKDRGLADAEYTVLPVMGLDWTPPTPSTRAI